MISVHSCVRTEIPVHLRDDDVGAFMCEGWHVDAFTLWVTNFYAFMCEGYDSGAFTWEMIISVYLCVIGSISVHLPEEWRFPVHSCVRGKTLVHLLEGWWFRCIHAWGVGRFYLRSDNLPCIHVWGVRLHRNRHSEIDTKPSSKYIGILPLTHECTANRHRLGKFTDILPLTHECTEIIIPQVNAPESYPSHMNAQKSSLLMWMHYYRAQMQSLSTVESIVRMRG